MPRICANSYQQLSATYTIMSRLFTHYC